MVSRSMLGQIMTISLVSILLSGCVSTKGKNEKVNSPIVSDYLAENGVTVLHGEECENGNCEVKERDSGEAVMTPIVKSRYENERDKMMTKIIKGPPIPMRVPDTILRTLIMPYADDGDVLSTYSYKFVKIDDGKWIMGEYLMNSSGQKRELMPLSGVIKIEGDDTDESNAQDDQKQRPAETSSNMQIPQSVNSVNARMQEEN